ncbi:MarR family winged helix-turn-helix transcriptional regulator [Arthrobacter rhizosphaerae]|uniref:MarR family winged helix-turn-helix transcriptional regulator n=1 Tax=Arthrobacter rhizosphaerae TaxID=2855490 RepID=UPI001FF69460|nr:MarR family transcriptional regulator [Arthrobacter rhizosphaerae]
MTRNARLANEAWEALFRAQTAIVRELEQSDVWADLPPRDYGVLYALSTAPEGKRITELGEDVLLTQPGLSRLFVRLEKSGLVQRFPDPDDKRVSRMRLTPAGAALQRRVGARHAMQVADAMTRTLDAGKLALLRDLCRELAATPHNSTAPEERTPQP